MSSVAELPNPSDEPGSPGQAAAGTSATVEVGVGGRLRHAGDGEPAPSDQLDGQADRPYPGGIPEATVARLPIYLRALDALAERGVGTVVLRGARRRGRRQLGQAAQGPVPPRLVRHPRRGLRRRVPRLPDLPRARPDPGLAGRHRRRRQPRPRPGQLRRLRHPRLPRSRRCSTPTRAGRPRDRRGLAVRHAGRARGDRGQPRRRDRRHRDPRRARPRRSATGWSPPG